MASPLPALLQAPQPRPVAGVAAQCLPATPRDPRRRGRSTAPPGRVATACAPTLHPWPVTGPPQSRAIPSTVPFFAFLVHRW